MFRELAAREVVSVMCEGGSELAGSLLAHRLPDQLHVFVAPLLLGPRGRPGAVDWAGPENPADAPRIDPARWAQTYAYLREREQPTETYVETRAVAALAGGGSASVLTFVSDRAHPQWAGDLTLEAQARLIAGAQGLSGRNIDYLRDLVEHLRAEGVRDHGMEALLARVEALEA
jgi:cation transport protein ChaC